MKDAERILNGVVLALVRERQCEGRDHGNLLPLPMRVRDEETGEAMAEDQRCSEALTYIGNEFALLEMCLIVAVVLQRFDVKLLPG